MNRASDSTTAPPMPVRVLKFGGTSMSALDRVADQVADERGKGHALVVVVSAAAGETDRLLAEAAILGEDGAALDLLLATGEQNSVARLVLALAKRGIPATGLTGAGAGVLTDGTAGRARILGVDARGVHKSLAAGRVVVVAGFQGVNENGAVTTLGRGGSDTTAVALAAALGAEECCIYTDVAGVYSADPRLEPQARRIDRVHCEEMLELAGLGSKVLAIEAVDYAVAHQVPLRVCSTFAPDEGTVVQHTLLVGAPPVVGVASSAAEAELAVIGLPARPGLAARLIAPLAAAGVAIDALVQNEARQGKSDVSFTVPHHDLERARALLAAEAGRLGAERLIEDASVAKVSVIGRGLRSNAQLLAKVLDTLDEAQVTVRVLVANETRITAIISEASLQTAVQALHKAFDLAVKEDK
ncbi:MAG: aspartate kinase [Gammaproteobacteria bacterium]